MSIPFMGGVFFGSAAGPSLMERMRSAERLRSPETRISAAAGVGTTRAPLQGVGTQADRLSSDDVTSADATSPQKDCAALNGLLRGEISAVDTYTQCIEKLDDPEASRRLDRLRQSHTIRRDHLSNRVRLLGGTPETHAGLWGAMTSLLEGGATILGEKAALKVLQEGELHGLRHYDGVDDVSSATRTFISTVLLPEQQETAAALTLLLKTLP